MKEFLSDSAVFFHSSPVTAHLNNKEKYLHSWSVKSCITGVILLVPTGGVVPFCEATDEHAVPNCFACGTADRLSKEIH